jgi:putative MATE family efflux protein
MKDLTKGSIGGLIVSMAAPIMVGMLAQTLYYMVDLYFVGRLGDVALAGVSAAGNVMLIVMALTQMLSVGAVSLIARAAGRQKQEKANQLFNQSMLMGLAGMLLALVAGYTLSASYLRAVGADIATQEAGLTYLHWYIPGLACQFILNALGAGLRGIGIVKPTMLVQLLTVLLNIALAPVLIAGWGTGVALGVAGAGLASTLAVLAGLVVTIWYFGRTEHYIRLDWSTLRPEWASIRAMFAIGFPAGAEFACMFLFMAIVYNVVSHFGTHAMAGFGVGARITQALSMPAMAIAFAIPAIAAQNLGAGQVARVREVIVKALQIVMGMMILALILCKAMPETLVNGFVQDTDAKLIAVDYIQLISWNFIASGLVFTASGMFQAFGNTWPSLFSTSMRIFIFAVPALYLSRTTDFTITDIWHLSVATVGLQALISLLLLRREWYLTQKRMMSTVALHRSW